MIPHPDFLDSPLAPACHWCYKKFISATIDMKVVDSHKTYMLKGVGNDANPY
jgi:hypothetical protein